MAESALPIGAEVIEAATLAFWKVYDQGQRDEAAMEAAIRAALDKMGLREEHRQHGPDLYDLDEVRLVTNWRPADEEPSKHKCGAIREHTLSCTLIAGHVGRHVHWSREGSATWDEGSSAIESNG